MLGRVVNKASDNHNARREAAEKLKPDLQKVIEDLDRIMKEGPEVKEGESSGSFGGLDTLKKDIIDV